MPYYRDVEQHKIISVHIFVTEIYDKFDMRTVLLVRNELHKFNIEQLKIELQQILILFSVYLRTPFSKS